MAHKYGPYESVAIATFKDGVADGKKEMACNRLFSISRENVARAEI